MAEGSYVRFDADLVGEGRVLKVRQIGELADAIAARSGFLRRGRLNGLGLDMGGVVLADAGGGDAAQVIGPLIDRLAPDMAGSLDIGLGTTLSLKAFALKDGGVDGLSRLLAVCALQDLGRDRNSLGLDMAGVVAADAGGGDSAQVLGPLIAPLAPIMAERFNIGLGTGLGLKVPVPENCGIGSLAGLLTGGLLCDLGSDLGDLGLDVSGIVFADAGGGDAAQIVGPFIDGLAPVVAERLRQRLDAALRGEDGSLKFRGKDGLAGLRAGGGFCHLRCGAHRLALHMRGVVLTDAGGGDAAHILAPLIAGIAPVMAKRIALGLPAAGAGGRLLTGGGRPAVLMARAQGEKHDNSQKNGQNSLQIAHSFESVSDGL